MISGLKTFLPEISAASQSGFYFFQCLMTSGECGVHVVLDSKVQFLRNAY